MTLPLLKCVIWDLDNTVWDGILSEGDPIVLRREALALVKRLHAAGIVQSIASKNDHDQGMRALASTSLADYFVYEQFSWSAKSTSIERIVNLLGIVESSVAFLDDSDFERAEVKARCPAVACFTLTQFLEFDAKQKWVPQKISEEAANRPGAYRAEASRHAAEVSFEGTPAEFLASLNMKLILRRATPLDLVRAAELTERTHQLNTTGSTFSVEELASLVAKPDSYVLISELTDRFGDYGRIGLSLVHRRSDHWFIELLLLSCRVLGRNLGGVHIGSIGQLAAADCVPLRARYRANGRNRQMQITLALLGFHRAEYDGVTTVYEHDNPGEIHLPAFTAVALEVTRSPIQHDENLSIPEVT